MSVRATYFYHTSTGKLKLYIIMQLGLLLKILNQYSAGNNYNHNREIFHCMY